MRKTMILLSFIFGLSACGDDQSSSAPASSGSSSAPAASSSSTASVAPAAPAESMDKEMAAPAAMDDEEFTYDPIDTAKLDSSWWQQYSAGS